MYYFIQSRWYAYEALYYACKGNMFTAVYCMQVSKAYARYI